MKEYHELYLKWNVSLLTVFRKFRNNILKIMYDVWVNNLVRQL